VVHPADTLQVAAVITLCARHGTAVVPQGGNTGLVGGGVPQGAEVVVSLQRLNAVEAVNAALGQVTVGAGAPESPANIRSSRVEGFTTIRRLGWR
jgi:FAD/FMN-containing dehydrogenase